MEAVAEAFAEVVGRINQADAEGLASATVRAVSFATAESTYGGNLI